MKKSLLCSVLFLLLFGSTLKAQGYQDPKNMEAINTSNVMTVDGLLNEPAWSSAYEYLIFGPNAPTTLNAKSVTGGALVKLDSAKGFWDTTWTKVKFLHSGMKLYVGIESNDKSVCKNGDSWEGDGLFLIIKSAEGLTHEFHLYYNAAGVNPEMVYESGGANAHSTWGFGKGVKHSGTIVNDTTQIDSGYTAELVLYLDSLGYNSKTTSIPVSIDIFDPDGFTGTMTAYGFKGNYDKTWWGSEWASSFRNLILYQDPPTMTAYTATSSITVDGNLNEPSWNDSYPYLVFGPNPVLNDPNARSVTSGVLVKDPFKDTSYTTMKFIRSGMKLYLGFQSNDKSVCRFGDSWEGDGLFMLIKNASGSASYEFHLYYDAAGVNPGFVYESGGGNPKPQWGNGVMVKGSTTIVNDTTQVDNGYSAELVIYLDSLGYTSSSTTVPVSIDIFDPDGYQGSMIAFGTKGSFYKTFWGSEWGSEYRNIILSNTATPVELFSFTGSSSGKNVELRWTTATEDNNRGFEIQRSLDKINFVPIGFVTGKGTTTEKTSYTFIDKNMAGGKLYYRLKQVDFNGTTQYTNTIEINRALDFTLSQNYPNPFNPSTVINFGLPFDANVTINVYNPLGALVRTITKGNYTAGNYNVEFNGSNLASGLYIYSLKATSGNGNSFVSTKKMMLLK
jgi:Secretion system C-terminal sorting domain